MDPGPDPPPPARRPGSAWHGATGGDPFSHPAVFYRGTPEYLSYTVPFILDGLAGDEPVAVAVPGPNLDAMRAEVANRGGQVGQVRWLDMTEAGRNPGRIIPTVLRAFADQHAGRRVRIIGEPIWAERDETEYPACAQHEALINNAFEGRQATILCPYDALRLGEVALADAAATHPILVEGDHWWLSPDYAPDSIVSGYNQPLPTPDYAEEQIVVADELGRIRKWAAKLAATAGLAAERVGDVVYVVNELVTNSIEHGRGMPRVLAWTTETALAFQTMNEGPLANPMAGRLPVAPNRPRGRGLLTANMLTDLIRIHTDEARTAIRAYFYRPTAQPTHGELTEPAEVAELSVRLASEGNPADGALHSD